MTWHNVTLPENSNAFEIWEHPVRELETETELGERGRESFEKLTGIFEFGKTGKNRNNWRAARGDSRYKGYVRIFK